MFMKGRIPFMVIRFFSFFQNSSGPVCLFGWHNFELVSSTPQLFRCPLLTCILGRFAFCSAHCVFFIFQQSDFLTQHSFVRFTLPASIVFFQFDLGPYFKTFLFTTYYFSILAHFIFVTSFFLKSFYSLVIFFCFNFF